MILYRVMDTCVQSVNEWYAISGPVIEYFRFISITWVMISRQSRVVKEIFEIFSQSSAGFHRLEQMVWILLFFFTSWVFRGETITFCGIPRLSF